MIIGILPPASSGYHISDNIVRMHYYKGGRRSWDDMVEKGNTKLIHRINRSDLIKKNHDNQNVSSSSVLLQLIIIV